MKWHHSNKIKASMAYIEKLIREIEESMKGKELIYYKVKNDFNINENKKIRYIIKSILKDLKKAKKMFKLKEDNFNLSHIANVNLNFIFETIEEAMQIEKTSGKIDSKNEKEKLWKIFNSIYEKSNLLNEISKNAERKQKNDSN